ncbi:aldo/keto reductase family protein [Saliterribacillus persicus]|uniref:Voltage-dependent potassium channel beta subunit n=1 Tax=Saliterribacillus persicus TaxID=930114 RepID=A0A368YGL0_9BACI|nr:aldo/keto reductase family protein [Saliterribacillus persicus]RCW77324.1 voltage-dependent potassium channel beta subunit [Saliterribacillus persicus]
MKYRRLGKSGLKVSEISLGSWLTYGKSVEDNTAEKTIHKAYDLGINFFDSANVYERGEGEKAMSSALKAYPRESYVLTTKAFFPMGDGPNDRGLSRKHISEQLNASLKRMNVDYVDVFYCHRHDPETPVQETLRVLDDMIRQGKILYAGVSEWSAAQIEEAVRIADKNLLDRIVVNQPQYNMLNRSIEKEIIPVSEKYGIGQVVFSPLAQGVLTGKYSGKDVPKDSRAANKSINNFIANVLTDDNLVKVDKLKDVAEELNTSLPTLALAWVLRQPNVSSALIGASRPSQVEENVKAIELELSTEIQEKIEGILG